MRGLIEFKKQKDRSSNLKQSFIFKSFCAYRVIAPTGHESKQAPQSMQVSSLTIALSSFIERASTGHVSIHAVQPTQESLSIFTAIISSHNFIFPKDVST